MSAGSYSNTLWVVTEVYYPEEISTGYYLTSIAEGLVAERAVGVLTGQPKHMARGLRAPKFEHRNGVDIRRVSGTTLNKDILLFRLVNMLTIGISMFFRSVFLFQRGDHILVCTAPPSLPVTTALACLIKGCSYTLLVQDSYPEILIAVGTIKKDSIFARFVHLVNQWVYKHALNIVVMGRDMKELFESKTAGLDIAIIPIPNWADLGGIKPADRSANQLLRELGLLDRFVLLYAGNIGHPTDVETIIDAAEMLKARSDIHFLFIGAGAKKRWLDDQIEGRELSNVTSLPYRPRHEQNEFLNACDIGLIALIPGMWGTAMPSRTYNIMAAGKPILALCDDRSELAQVIDEEAIGWHTPPRDALRLSQLIAEIREQKVELVEMGARARCAAEAKYSPEIAVKSYSDAVR